MILTNIKCLVTAYDRNGNLVEKATKDGTVKYEYTADDMLKGVYYPDDSGVEYTYDAFRRKTSRTETYYDLKDLDKVKADLEKSNNGKSNNGNSNNSKENNGNTKEKTNNGNAGLTGKENAITRGDGEKTGLIKQLENPYGELLKTETTYYQYDGLNVINEYDEHGATLAEYQIANGEVLARQMFGNHGRKEQGYEGNIRTRGGLMYYQTDALGNVMDVTDHTGDTVMKYRYDAFGNLFTQMAAPYNTTGYTGKSYDAKAGLMDYSARWYSPSTGRFTSEDTFLGWMEEPLSLNRYSYVHNNPVNYIDPTGHKVVEGEDGDDGPYFLKNVGLYVDDVRKGSVELWSNSKTYFSNGTPVRSYYTSKGYTVKWSSSKGVLVYTPNYGSDDDGGDSSDGNDDNSGSNDDDSGPTLEEQIANSDNLFDSAAGEMPEISQEYLNQIEALIQNGSEDDINGLLDGLLDLTQSITGREDVGVVAFVTEIEANGIIGVHADTGTYLDSNGNYYNIDNGSISVKSNIEVSVTEKVVIMPYLDDINKLTGFGMSAEIDAEVNKGISAGIGIGLASAHKESASLSLEIGLGNQIVPIADVSLNIGYSDIVEPLTPEEIEELIESLDNLQLGGF